MCRRQANETREFSRGRREGARASHQSEDCRASSAHVVWCTPGRGGLSSGSGSDVRSTWRLIEPSCWDGPRAKSSAHDNSAAGLRVGAKTRADAIDARCQPLSRTWKLAMARAQRQSRRCMRGAGGANSVHGCSSWPSPLCHGPPVRRRCDVVKTEGVLEHHSRSSVGRGDSQAWSYRLTVARTRRITSPDLASWDGKPGARGVGRGGQSIGQPPEQTRPRGWTTSSGDA